MTEYEIPEKVRAAARRRTLGGSIWVDGTSARPWWQARGYVYEEGVVTTGGWPGRLLRVRPAQRWEDVATLRHRFRVLYRYERDLGSVIAHRSDRFDLTFGDGGRAGFYVGEAPDRTLASDYFAYGMRPDGLEVNKYASAAIEAIEDKVSSALAPRLHGELGGGRRVDFGALSATQGGLEHDGEEFPWRHLGKLTMSARPVSNTELKEKGQVTSPAMITLSGVTTSGKVLDLSLRPDSVYNFGTLKRLRRLMG